ncbi:hypothetical protein NDU88_001255 [Pleurodeles waltl]|uniref:Uncharacterized protein n=1 Tax=Pleurodeles waltl TaxID=8319 RepID=A0AAV7R817_PLEWA|nr:hypothetical protein NDU88_001255 [Pleurodeles waltl]
MNQARVMCPPRGLLPCCTCKRGRPPLGDGQVLPGLAGGAFTSHKGLRGTPSSRRRVPSAPHPSPVRGVSAKEPSGHRRAGAARVDAANAAIQGASEQITGPAGLRIRERKTAFLLFPDPQHGVNRGPASCTGCGMPFCRGRSA